MNNKALILVDFEKQWIDEKSDYFVGDVSDLIQRTNKLIDYCRQSGYKIIFTRHVEEDSEEEFAPNSENVEIIDGVNKQESDAIITKNKISPFYKTKLEQELEGVGEMVICGILTNLCVRSLAQDAYDRDFDITIVKDCCKAFDKETHEFTIKDLKKTREEIRFLNVDEFLN
ncbi:MAG: isochorismatase family cysteine hydrolase [Candidatus Moranbacteria bacterium]|nr:isochorismatase family cysteine hydrolase [Candidatus Moranbacteria bacterium]